MSILNGEGARAEFNGVTFAGAGQDLDTGAKIVHNAPNTTSYINSRSISKGGGRNTYRSSTNTISKSEELKIRSNLSSLLMLDNISTSDTIPVMDVRTRMLM